jgi:hypothetical protein
LAKHCALRQVVDGQTLDRIESGRSASTSKAAGKRSADRRKEAANDGEAVVFADLVADGTCVLQIAKATVTSLKLCCCVFQP